MLWSAPETIGAGRSDRYWRTPSIVLTGDTVIVVANSLPYGDGDAPDSSPAVFWRVPGGVQSLPKGDFQFVDPRIVRDSDGRLHLFWSEFVERASTTHEWNRPGAAIWHASLDAGRWTKPERLLHEFQIHWSESPGSLAIDASRPGDIHIAVPVDLKEAAVIVHLYLHDGKWQRTDLPYPSAHAAVSASNGISTIAFVGSATMSAVQQQGLMVISAMDGGMWSAPQLIDPYTADEISDRPYLLNKSSRTALIWGRRTRNAYNLTELRMAVRTSPTSAWQSMPAIPLGEAAISLKGSMTGCGDVMVAVQRFDGKVFSMKTVHFVDGKSHESIVLPGWPYVRDVALTAEGTQVVTLLSASPDQGQKPRPVVMRATACRG